jgi:hypothetical protein
MYLSNIKDNIVKAPMVGHAQNAAHGREEVAAGIRQEEELDLARQADEQVKELNQSENETIRREQERVKERNGNNSKREQHAKEDEQNDSEETSDEHENNDSDDGTGPHVIDIVI